MAIVEKYLYFIQELSDKGVLKTYVSMFDITYLSLLDELMLMNNFVSGGELLLYSNSPSYKRAVDFEMLNIERYLKKVNFEDINTIDKVYL